MEFTLEIELGNEAMQTRGDVAAALKRVATALTHYGAAPIKPTDAGPIAVRDLNGNTIGKWEVTA